MDSQKRTIQNQLSYTHGCDKAESCSCRSYCITGKIIYANEADVLNVAMFGMTARQWRDANPELKGNIRDYATINELICLSNMESLNAVFIDEGLPQRERLIKLNQIAIQQMKVLKEVENRRLLK